MDFFQDQRNLTYSSGSISGRIEERQLKLAWPVPGYSKIISFEETTKTR